MFETIKASTLTSALRAMEVGQTQFAPKGRSRSTIKRTCTLLAKEGYVFTTSTRLGEQTITRLK